MPKRIHRRTSALLLIAAIAAPTALAAPNFSKYPLRINILSSTSYDYYIQPSLGGPMQDNSAAIAAAGGDAGPGVPMGGGLSLSYDPVRMFYGTGRADLVTTSDTTSKPAAQPVSAPANSVPNIQGLNFNYTNCMGRLGMTLPDKAFYARWKKKNAVLELIVPIESTAIPKPGAKPAATKYDKCDVNVTLQKNIYLLLRTGTVVAISPDDFAKKPALRQFTVGLDPKLLPRTTTGPAPIVRRPMRPTTPTTSKPSNNPGSAASDSSPSAH